MRLDLSLINCHVRGLHSLVLDPAPRMRRIFFATPDHEMAGPDDLALHSHHCDVELRPLYGGEHVIHWRPADVPSTVTAAIYTGFLYSSVITGKVGRFEVTGEPRGFSLLWSRLVEPAKLRARDIHTVSVELHQRAAWVVVEGAEDQAYDPTCWSRRDLSRWTPEGLYQPMTEEFLKAEFPLSNPAVYSAVCG